MELHCQKGQDWEVIVLVVTANQQAIIDQPVTTEQLHQYQKGQGQDWVATKDQLVLVVVMTDQQVTHQAVLILQVTRQAWNEDPLFQAPIEPTQPSPLQKAPQLVPAIVEFRPFLEVLVLLQKLQKDLIRNLEKIL